MCAIAGIYAPSGWLRGALKTAAKEMAGTMHHRGPDANGVWVDAQWPLALAHQRLSIQDLSAAGHQPMSSNNGRYHIVFNGEIYNFGLLANELRNLGHRFRGHSDTEVLLAAIEEWGIEATLKLTRGMFAMVLWDRKVQELVLCRDRMGEKPLFYGWVRKCFVFASELKAFNSIFHEGLTINKSAMAAFFRFGYVPTPYSIYENIFKLVPGTILRLPIDPLPPVNEFHPLPGKTAFSPQPYWKLESVARQGYANPILDDKEAIETFNELLQETIKLQKVADVPIGAFLSGGIDSSLVAAVLQAVSGNPISSFTMGFKEKEFDEAPYARSIAKHLGTNHHEYYISANDGLDLIQEIPEYWDEPFADSSQIPSLLIAKMARKKVTVCLTGDGGDELFCGYNRYFTTARLWSKEWQFPYWLRWIFGKSILSIPSNTWQEAYMLLKRATCGGLTQANAGLKIHKMGELLLKESINDGYRYLMSYWEKPVDVVNSIQEAESVITRQPTPELGAFINDAMYWDQLGYLVDDNLVKGDRSSMAVSLEARLPLLDHRIVEFSWRLPLSMKYRAGKSKWLLRQVLYRYVPKKLMERPKMGFSVPIREWLKGPLREWAGDLLHSKDIAECFINEKTIDRVWSEHLNGNYDHSQKMWTICMWLIWYRKYFHG